MRRWILLLALLFALPLPVGAQSPRIQAPLTSTDCPGTGCVTLSVQGLGAASVQVTGTFTGTLEFETSLDGVTYTSWTVTPSGGGASVTSATAAGIWQGSIGGLGILRTRFSAHVSGIATVTMQAADNGTNLLTQSNTWAGTQTFNDIATSGTASSDTQVLFNDGGTISGDSGLLWEPDERYLAVVSNQTGLGVSAIQSFAEYDGTDSNQQIAAYFAQAGANGTSTDNDLFGIIVESGYVSGGATAGSNSGITVRDQAVAGAANYAIRTGTGLVSFGDVVKLGEFAFADLPTATAGSLAYVNNSNTATWGATIAGGGVNKVLAFFNGTNWTVAGK